MASGNRILKGNGLSPAIFRLGRRVLLSESRFFSWIDAQQKHATRKGAA